MRRGWRIVGFGLIALLLIGLYRAKIDADATRAEVARLEAELARTRAEVKTLAAEAAHLGRPARIEALAERHLGLTADGAAVAVGLDALDAVAPVSAEEGVR